MARKTLKNATFDSTDVKASFLEALSIMGEDGPTVLKCDVDERFTPTNSIVFDNVLRLRGLPRGGRVYHIHGKEHGGKSTICYSFVKAFQKSEDEPAVIFDFEGTCTGNYLRGVGVDTARTALAVRRPESMDDAIKQTIVFMKAGVKLFIYDSIPRMKSMVDEKDIMSGQAMKASVGEHARGMQKFFDILMPYAMKYDCLFLMVNQIRARIEMTNEALQAQKYPSITNLNYTMPGGNSVRFIPSVSIEVNVQKAFRAGGFADDPFILEPGDNKGDYVATKVKVRIIKNKATTGGYREHHLWLRPGLGIDDWISVRELARHYGLIVNKGKKYLVGDEDKPIATYDSKDEAIRNLVTEPDYEVLARLKVLVAKAIEDDKGGFTAELTQADKFLAGDSESLEEDSVVRVTAFDDEDL
jgi:RecA/RadA recombinase